MKTIQTILIAAALLTQSIYLLQAQSTEGTKFWLTFGQNGSNPNNIPDLQIRIAAKDHSAIGRIHFTNLGTYKDFDIQARQTYTYPLSSTEATSVYNTTMGIFNKSICITSSDPVSVYAMNQHPATADATNILPVTVLGTEYYQISYSCISDRYGVVATEDNTDIFHNNFHIGTLNAGEVYYRISTTGDMTGTFISSSKPIAFFSLSRGFGINPLSALDHGMQQLAPINTWGKEFFVPVSHIIKDHVRIVASQNGTNISQSGGTIHPVSGGQTSLTNLQAGQFVELAVPLSSNGCHIVANHPVGVCTYLWGGNNYGDAAICWLPPKEQSVKSALIAPFIPNPPTNITAHYATVFTPTATRDNTKVSIGGGAPTGLTGGVWIANTASGMSFYKMPLTNSIEAYYLTNPAGLLVLCYGVGNSESYYYPAGFAMRDLDAAFYANDIHFQDLKDNSFCEGLVEFRTEIEGLHPTASDSIMWYIDNVFETSAATWNKPFENGTYEIKLVVHYDNDTYATLTGTLRVQALWIKIKNVRY